LRLDLLLPNQVAFLHVKASNDEAQFLLIAPLVFGLLAAFAEAAKAAFHPFGQLGAVVGITRDKHLVADDDRARRPRPRQLDLPQEVVLAPLGRYVLPLANAGPARPPEARPIGRQRREEENEYRHKRDGGAKDSFHERAPSRGWKMRAA